MEYDLSVTDSVELHYFKKLKSILYTTHHYMYAGIKFYFTAGFILCDDWSFPKGSPTARFHSSLKGPTISSCSKQLEYRKRNVNLHVATLPCHFLIPYSFPSTYFLSGILVRAGTHGSDIEVSFTVWARQWSENFLRVSSTENLRKSAATNSIGLSDSSKSLINSSRQDLKWCEKKT
jgi:hypothetical protein